MEDRVLIFFMLSIIVILLGSLLALVYLLIKMDEQLRVHVEIFQVAVISASINQLMNRQSVGQSSNFQEVLEAVRTILDRKLNYHQPFKSAYDVRQKHPYGHKKKDAGLQNFDEDSSSDEIQDFLCGTKTKVDADLELLVDSKACVDEEDVETVYSTEEAITSHGLHNITDTAKNDSEIDADASVKAFDTIDGAKREVSHTHVNYIKNYHFHGDIQAVAVGEKNRLLYFNSSKSEKVKRSHRNGYRHFATASLSGNLKKRTKPDLKEHHQIKDPNQTLEGKGQPEQVPSTNINRLVEGPIMTKKCTQNVLHRTVVPDDENGKEKMARIFEDNETMTYERNTDGLGSCFSGNGDHCFRNGYKMKTYNGTHSKTIGSVTGYSLEHDMRTNSGIYCADEGFNLEAGNGYPFTCGNYGHSNICSSCGFLEAVGDTLNSFPKNPEAVAENNI